MDNIISIDNYKKNFELNLLGGKAYNLFKLLEKGFNVPTFIVISAAVSSDILIKKKLDDNLKNEINDSLKKYFNTKSFLSVRSSCTLEDSRSLSFAGQFDTYLYVNGKNIFESVLNCFLSVNNERSTSYRKINNRKEKKIKIAVIIQKMIDSSVSGVAFSVNPLSKRINEILISSSFGLGEGLVSGDVDSDHFIVDKCKNFLIKEKNIVDKKDKIIYDFKNKQGTIKCEINADEKNKCTLNDKNIIEIAKTTYDIEKSYAFIPQDIEWSIDNNGTLFILQSRPITTLDKILPSTDEEKILWDNSNIIESYSGITKPLTYSFALSAYHMVYVQFCEILGVPKNKIQEFDRYFSGMLGLLNGRIYYNLNNWCRLISVLPGYNYNRKFMEQMMGVKDKIEFNVNENKKLSIFKKYFIEFPILLYTGFRLIYTFITIKKRVNNFMKTYQLMYDKYKRFNYTESNNNVLMNAYYDLVNKVLRNWKAPIINDFMAMIFMGLLKEIIFKWGIDSTGNLHNELLSRQGNVESIKPLNELKNISDYIKKKSKLYKLFSQKSENDLIDTILKENNPEYKNIKELILKYLDNYGDRAMNELKLEEPSLYDKPDFIFSIIKNYLNTNFLTSKDTAGENKKNKIIYKNIIKKLFQKNPLLFLIRYTIFEFILKMTKKAVSFREYQRFARTRMFGIARRIFNAVGNNFKRLGLLDDKTDIFYLKKEEIFDYIEGKSINKDLKSLVALRKKDYEYYEALPELPERIITYGAVYANNLFAQEDNSNSNIGDGILKGTSCSAGVVRGIVKVILNPGDNVVLNGEILVASKTDPGWVCLYPSASGLLVERGSILSHSAIVARELGLPAIVGIPRITEILKTGDEIEMDGSTGIIKIINKI